MIAIFFTALGLVLMVAWRLSSAGKPFFTRRGFEKVPDGIAADTAAKATAPAGSS